MKPLTRPEGFAAARSWKNRVMRVAWRVVWWTLYRPSPRVVHAWRRALLRAFGARIGRGARVYPGARVWAPWNLQMGVGSCLAGDVDCYSVAQVTIGDRATVSQYSYLCTASHDYRDRSMPLVVAPISIGADAWVTAGVFVGPGVEIGEGAIAAARSVVVADVAPWTIVAGNPARFVKDRERFR